MIRISRIVAKNRIFDLLKQKHVSKIGIRQGKQNFKNPAICKIDIYLKLDDDSSYFKSIMSNIKEWGIKHKINIAVTTANMAMIDGFIKESAFDDFDYPMPKKYKELCKMYSQDWINLFNYRKV